MSLYIFFNQNNQGIIHAPSISFPLVDDFNFKISSDDFVFVLAVFEGDVCGVFYFSSWRSSMSIFQ